MAGLGWAKVSWSFTVENTGNVTVSGVSIADQLASPGVIAYTWPDSSAVGVLKPGQKVSAVSSSALTQAQIDAGKVSNTASASVFTGLVKLLKLNLHRYGQPARRSDFGSSR